MVAYELTYLVSPEIGDAKAEEFIKAVEDMVSASGGGNLKSPEPARRTWLYYNIKHKAEAILAVLEFEQEPNKVLELKGQLEKKQEILRFLLVKKDKPAKEKKEKPAKKIKPDVEELADISSESVIAEPINAGSGAGGEEKKQEKKRGKENPGVKKPAIKKEKEKRVKATQEDLEAIERDLDKILGE